MESNRASKEPNHYVFELNDIDVLCGRGSGPNDRAGNIAFRNLILTRKAEYLAVTSRDAKGTIAAEIVQDVRSRGGRFVKKLSPAQVKEAGFKRGVAVYELADEPTVLEKAKQTLRQNRAKFDAVNGGFVAAAAEKVVGGTFKTVAKGGEKLKKAMCSKMSALPVKQPSLSSLEPIPLSEASLQLDSTKLPVISGSTADQLQKALFASSVSTNYQNDPQAYTNAHTSSTGNLSMAEALASAFASTKSGTSTNSAEVFESLLKEYNSIDEMTLMNQYAELKAQQCLMIQQQLMMQQQARYPNQGEQPTLTTGMQQNGHMGMQQQMNYQQAGTMPIQYQQHDRHTQDRPSQFHQYCQHTESDIQRHVQPQHPNATGSMNNMQEPDLSESSMRQYINDSTSLDQSQSVQLMSMLSMQSNNLQNPSGSQQKLASDDAGSGNVCGSLVRQYDSEKLLQQYEQMQSQQMTPLVQSAAPQDEVGGPQKQESDNSFELAALLQHGEGQAGETQSANEPARHPRRRSVATAEAPAGKNAPVEADNRNEESLRLSFLTANHLAATLKDDTMIMPSGQVDASESKRPSVSKGASKRGSAMDASLMSLMSMSMSLSEISHDMATPGNKTSSVTKSMNRVDEGRAEGDKRCGEQGPVGEAPVFGDVSMMKLGESSGGFSTLSLLDDDDWKSS
eukprot:g3228.t1 g3228   contig12:1662734-1664858(+)